MGYCARHWGAIQWDGLRGCLLTGAKIAPLWQQFQQALSATPLITGPLPHQPMRAGPRHMPIHTCPFKETLRYSTTTR
jgi:hypothetical protein